MIVLHCTFSLFYNYITLAFCYYFDISSCYLNIIITRRNRVNNNKRKIIIKNMSTSAHSPSLLSTAEMSFALGCENLMTAEKENTKQKSIPGRRQITRDE